jgi:hypothetical protein
MWFAQEYDLKMIGMLLYGDALQTCRLFSENACVKDCYVVRLRHVSVTLVERGTRAAPSGTSEYKMRQRQNTPGDKALVLEAAFRIMKLGERDILILDKLLDALRARSLPIQDARRISQVALLNTKGNNQLSAVAAPPVIDTIADEEEDSDDEEEFRSA